MDCLERNEICVAGISGGNLTLRYDVGGGNFVSLGLDFLWKFSRETPLSYISDRNLGVSLTLYNATLLEEI